MSVSSKVVGELPVQLGMRWALQVAGPGQTSSKMEREMGNNGSEGRYSLPADCHCLISMMDILSLKE